MKEKGRTEGRIVRRLLSFLTGAAVTAAVILGAADKAIPQRKAVVLSVETQAETAGVTSEVQTAGQSATAKFWGIPLKDVALDVLPKARLIPCGSVFGVKFFTKGVLIVGMSDVESTEGILSPAYRSGLRVKDVILSIDGNEVNTVEEVAQAVDRSSGKALDVTFARDGETANTTLIPLMSLTDSKYKTGLWIRDSTAGIGTVTYYDPDTGEFGGLGHGICDVDTGELMPMLRASVVDIRVTDIVKGLDGSPGEIKGSFDVLRIGELRKNTTVGVFGVLEKAPACAFSEPLEIGTDTQVHEGEAYLYASLGDKEVRRYTVELTKIYRNGSDTKNFIFTVTDPALLLRTGGVVQGMSGSPIVQDGRLIGAVTHVLVNNPKKGYGIFIGNMLAAAKQAA